MVRSLGATKGLPRYDLATNLASLAGYTIAMPIPPGPARRAVKIRPWRSIARAGRRHRSPFLFSHMPRPRPPSCAEHFPNWGRALPIPGARPASLCRRQDLAGIQNAAGVEGQLQAAHHGQRFLAEELAHRVDLFH